MLQFDEFRSYCLGKPFVTEGFPFDQKTLVFKVDGKMFALSDVDNFQSVNLKADPEQSIEFRERYIGVEPGYHMSKKHWNTVQVNSDVSRELFLQMVDASYLLVYNSLTKKRRNELEMG